MYICIYVDTIILEGFLSGYYRTVNSVDSSLLVAGDLLHQGLHFHLQAMCRYDRYDVRISYIHLIYSLESWLIREISPK